ncbi:MAG: hypothetical protein RLZZ156_2560 [Deinococcota bacterium]|jgi:hypothetical protein
MKQGFDFSTPEILDWELDAVNVALFAQNLKISPHALQAARDEGIPYHAILETILVGVAVSKDLPDNGAGRQAGINFEYLFVKRWLRVKVSWQKQYYAVTVHTI